jgi:hypothetical protein
VTTPGWVILWPQWLADLDRAVDYAQDAVREAAAGLVAALDGEWEASAARYALPIAAVGSVRPYLRAALTDPHSGLRVASGWPGYDNAPADRRPVVERWLLASWERPDPESGPADPPTPTRGCQLSRS